MPDGVVVDPGVLRDWPLPAPGSDKEERGRLVLVAGSRDTPGAGLLAAEAALRVGAGKVQLVTARSCGPSLAVSAPELMVTGALEDDAGNIDAAEADRILEWAQGSRAVLLGPGFTDTDVAAELVGRLLPHLESTAVLDALATAYVTGGPERLAALATPVLLTVNPSELAECLQLDETEVGSDLAMHTTTLARRTRAVIVCGGPTKFVAYADDLWRVEAGNAGLGTAGSGDVQAGIVAGLLARGAEPAQAAVWGAYLHGTAGDRLAASVGPLGYLARQLTGELPGLLAGLEA
jgi:ADP-dependent NAD(P)H-hydrate dehydratase